MRPGAEHGESALPPALRGPDGFVRLVQGIGLRVTILGTRGKSTLGAMAAGALKRRNIPTYTNAPAPPSDTVAVDLVSGAFHLAGFERHGHAGFAHAVDGLQRSWPVAAAILRNPGATPALQREFHAKVALPHYVLLTNVRRDPQGLVPKGPEAAARAAVQGVTPGATLISGESDPALKAVLRRECERLGVPFLDAAPARMDVPGAEAVSVLDALLLHRFGAGLQPGEEDALRRELETRFRWSPSTIAGVRFFDAGPIHDVDSTQIVLNHLQALRRHPVTFVAYFRRDRPGRTRAYVPFLADLLNAPDTRQVILCGAGARGVASRLQRWESQVHVVAEEMAAIPRLVRRLEFEGQGGAIVTLANGAGDWPRALVAALQKTPAPAIRAARTETSTQALAPKRIVRPLVAPAPSIPDLGETFARLTRPAGARSPAPSLAPGGFPAAVAALPRAPGAKAEPAGNPQ
jgi:hypothetical protein